MELDKVRQSFHLKFSRVMGGTMLPNLFSILLGSYIGIALIYKNSYAESLPY